MHDVLYHDIGYVIGFVTPSLIFDLPIIIHHFILITRAEWAVPEILYKSVAYYFTSHWRQALALGLQCVSIMYCLFCICGLIRVTLLKKASWWDKFLALIVLTGLVMASIGFLIYVAVPFIKEAFTNGLATTVVNYLWKSLNFITGQSQNADHEQR